jgi:Lrp/AsnC family transcriptional regulator for asnA, asnC and gidA
MKIVKFTTICDIIEKTKPEEDYDMMSQSENISSRIDEIDLQIIKILNEDGRTPFSQIAQQLDVSTGMIRQRYQRLVQDGVLQVVAVTNPLLMGFSTMAQIGVKVDVGRMQEIAEKIASFEEVVYLVLLTGSYDLHIEIVCRNKSHLLDFLTNKLYSVEGIKDSETFIYMQIAKEVYTWTGYLDGKKYLNNGDHS